MDKVFSVRVGENTIQKIAMLSKELKISKKAVIEEAVVVFIQNRPKCKNGDVFKKTLGAWQRPENTVVTVKKAREEFIKSMQKHHT